MECPSPLPLPDDPALAAMAAALRDAGHWAEIVDRNWHLVYSTEDLRQIYGGLTDLAPVALGVHYFGSEAMSIRLRWRSGPSTLDLVREMFGVFGGLVLADTVGGRDRLRELVPQRSVTSSTSCRPSTRRQRFRSRGTGCTSARPPTHLPQRCVSTIPPGGSPGPR